MKLSGDEIGCLAVLAVIAVFALIGAGVIVQWLYWLLARVS